MEPNNTRVVVAKRLWNIVRIFFFMIRKGISKNNKYILHIHHLMTKRGKIAGKAIGNLMFHHYNNNTHNNHHSRDPHVSFTIPREYEFSCGNSPAYFPSFQVTNKRKSNCHQRTDELATVNAVTKLLEMLNNEVTVESVMSSPILPGFGRSPMVRQLRITDSPFPLKDVSEISHVDEDAEEFIERFYEQLRLQNKS